MQPAWSWDLSQQAISSAPGKIQEPSVGVNLAESVRQKSRKHNKDIHRKENEWLHWRIQSGTVSLKDAIEGTQTLWDHWNYQWFRWRTSGDTIDSLIKRCQGWNKNQRHKGHQPLALHFDIGHQPLALYFDRFELFGQHFFVAYSQLILHNCMSFLHPK